MNAQEVRIRCIEAIGGTGVREVTRLIADARALEAWVNSAEDKQDAPRRGRPPKTADKE